MSGNTSTNFFQPTQFEVVVNDAMFNRLPFFIQSVDHPSLSSSQTEQSEGPTTNVPLGGERLVYPEVTFVTKADENLVVYKSIFDWMQNIANTPPIKLREDPDKLFEVDMSLLVKNSANVTIRTITYLNAFPVTLGNLQMGSDQDSNPITLPITFNYSTFTIS